MNRRCLLVNSSRAIQVMVNSAERDKVVQLVGTTESRGCLLLDGRGDRYGRQLLSRQPSLIQARRRLGLLADMRRA